jgi:hypothetical protein
MFLITANKPAKTNAERAEEMMRNFPDKDTAMECAESWLRDGYVAVKLWKLDAEPRIKQIVDWGGK